MDVEQVKKRARAGKKSYAPEFVADPGRAEMIASWQLDATDTSQRSYIVNKTPLPQASPKQIQDECWLKFSNNPQLSTAVRGLTGRMTGWGFKVCSDVFEIQQVVDEIESDPRNLLPMFWRKYIGRFLIEGELFLLLTCHDDGFIEVDFIDPTSITGIGTEADSGVIYHPRKPYFPLFYNVATDYSNITGQTTYVQIPSINIARYPAMMDIVKTCKDYKEDLTEGSRHSGRTFSKVGGFSQFILMWDRGFMTQRTVSPLRTTLAWINRYEALKMFEIDHKKGSGAYLWVYEFLDQQAYNRWHSMSDADKAKTGIFQKYAPGGRLVLPFGMSVKCMNPQLTRITDQDNDILQMVASGLNESEDVLMGSNNGSYASVKASRGPMSDRVSDEIGEFDRFLRNMFWSSIFFLKSKINGFPEFFKVDEVVGFKKKENVIKKVKRRPDELLAISYPVSETNDLETRARALLGVKHGPVSETVGISQADVAEKLGFGNYGVQRLRHATEKTKYPDLVYNLDAESLQERIEAERKRNPSQEVEEDADQEDI